MNNLETENLLLLDCDLPILKAALKADQGLEKFLKIKLAENWTAFGKEMFGFAIELLSGDEAHQGWLTYLPIHKTDRLIIGTGGYKGKPSPEGTVEIGYEIAPAYRNRGLATEMALALVKNAFGSADVNCVLAHTLMDGAASAKVLSKCGFCRTVQVLDPEDGPIWRWELLKEDFEGHG